MCRLPSVARLESAANGEENTVGPEVGATFSKNGNAATVESVKAASEIYAPIAGTVAEANVRAIDDPTLIGQAPEGEGWLARLHPSDTSEIDSLMDADGYRALLDSLGAEQ